MKLEDLPLVIPLAEWIWDGGNDGQREKHPQFVEGGSDENFVSPTHCLSQIPFLSSRCIEPLITKVTGIGIIVGACFNKAPTVVNMIQAQSAEGLSRSGLYSEALFYANSSIYSILMNHPFTAVRNLSHSVGN